jgi:hypothetical protein
MFELTGKQMIFLFTVVFPLLFLVAALLLGSGVCIIISLLVWIGIAIIMIYLPTTAKE